MPLSDETDVSSEEVVGGDLLCAEPPGRALSKSSSMLFDGEIPRARMNDNLLGKQ